MARRIPNPDLEEVRLALRDRSIELVTHVLGGPPNRAHSNRREARWGQHGSFSLATTGPKSGLWFDFEAQEGGDLIHLIRCRQISGGFQEAYEWARGWLGWPIDGPALPDKKAEERWRKQEKLLAKNDAGEDEIQHKIAVAKTIYDRSTPIHGTIAEAYITQTRQIPARPWPEALRFDPVEQALVVTATTNDGKFAAVQMVRLSPNGEKIDGNGPKLVKQSFGTQANAAVRLPGPADQPLLLAEGPETGLSAWATTGYETWVALGRVTKKLTPPSGRLIIVLHDDDKPQASSKDPTQCAISAWEMAGHEVASAWPWEARRKDGSDFNDVLKAHGAAAVQARIELVAKPAMETEPNLFDLETARQMLDERAGSFMQAAQNWRSTEDNSPPVHALAVSLGVGKTEAALRHVVKLLVKLRAASDHRVCVFAVPEHRLSEEVAKRFSSLAEGTHLRVAIWRGREARLPNGGPDEKMCGDIETVREAQRVYAHLKHEVCRVCHLEPKCPYIAQSHRQADLWVVSHKVLFMKAPLPIKSRVIAALIVDESPYSAGLIGVEDDVIELPLDALDPGCMPTPKGEFGDLLTEIRRTLKDALFYEVDGPVRRTALLGSSLLATSADQAAKLEWLRKIKVGKWRDREANVTLGPMSALWRAVDHFLSPNGPELSGRMVLGRTHDGARCLTITGRKDIEASWHVPTMLIDATFDEELVRPYWPQLEVKARIDAAAPNQHIKQVICRSFSKAMLAPIVMKKENEHVEKKNLRRNQARRRLTATISRIERESGGEMLVVSNKAIVDALKLPPHIHRAHFNAVAGRDQWRDVRTVIIIGRPQPNPASVERMAGALTGKAPLSLPKWYARGDVIRRVNDGTTIRQIAGTADRHPDEMAERIRGRICEGEIMQAIGRGRGVSRTVDNPLQIIVLSDVVLPLAVDEFLSDKDFLNPSPADEMLALGGVAFEDAMAAYEAYPGLWPSAEAAKKALQRRNRGTEWNKRLTLPKCPADRLVEVVYQRSGPKRHRARATVDRALALNPRAAIENAIGALVFFEILK